jgi:hypothetical protein
LIHSCIPLVEEIALASLVIFGVGRQELRLMVLILKERN